MFVVCNKDTLALVEEQCRAWGVLYGDVVDDDVYRITGLHPSGQAADGPLGMWVRSTDVLDGGEAQGPVAIVLTDDGPQFWRRGRNGRLEERVDGAVVDIEHDLMLRLKGVADTAQLKDRAVAVVGCGSLGSRIVMLQVCAGVGHVILLDPQRLETHNVIRHECGISDVGRLKVHALAERLRDKNPAVEIRCCPPEVCLDPERIAHAIAGADIVIAATDSPRAQLTINRIALAHGKPVIFPGAYNYGFGGEVIRVIPGETACLRCVYDATAESFQRVEPGEDGQKAAYDADNGHPGMWIDVGFMSHLAARMALETLLGQRDPDVNLTGHYLLWGNRRLWAFSRPLESHWLTIPRNPTCPVCGGVDSMDARLAENGMDRAAAEKLAATVLADAQIEDSVEEAIS